MAPPARPNPVLKHALPLPSMNKMINKRVILASASPRRLEILSSLGLSPEVIPSTFAEDLPHSSFSDDLTKYPTATAGEKGREVYERLVGGEAAEEGVDLVIAADTVVIYPPVRDPEARLELGEGTGGEESIILEKPTSPGDNLRTLLNLSGKTVQVVTSVVLVYPTLTNPGFALRSLSDSTLVTFHENSRAILEAYVDSGEGMGKAGGFGIQGLGGLLVEKIEGDHNNVVGFPASAFFRWMDELLEEDEDFLNI